MNPYGDTQTGFLGVQIGVRPDSILSVPLWARPVIPLSDSKCEAAKPREKPYKLADGQGLYLLVRPTGSKVWRMKYNRPGGQENTLTFGEYGRQGISLARAREERRKARDLLAQGVDPAEQAKLEEAKAKNATTFEAVTREWHAAQVKRGKWSAGHAERVLREMEADLFPAIGKRPVEQLKTRDLLAPLLDVEARDALDMAARLKQRLCAVMRHATQTGLLDYNPAQDLGGAISTRKATHRPALPLERLGELLGRIDGYAGRPLTKHALQLTLQVFVRSSELRMPGGRKSISPRPVDHPAGARGPARGEALHPRQQDARRAPGAAVAPGPGHPAPAPRTHRIGRPGISP